MATLAAFDNLGQDIRFALRTLRKSPAFTTVAVLALGVGMAGSIAIFSLVDAMRAGALPYRDAERLVELWGTVQRAKVERRGNSYPDFQDWRAQSKSFEDMAAFDNQTLTLREGDEPERIGTESVSASYFRVLGQDPALGRVFRDDEDVVENPTYSTVLSDGLWKRRFGSDPKIVGRQIKLNSDSYTVVGVMPQGFKGVTDSAELWTPFAVWAPPSTMANRGTRGFGAIARFRPGVTLASAQGELDTISKRLEQTYPGTNQKRAVEVSPLDVEIFGSLRPALLALLAAVAFVLLIACANVANLVLARSEARRREIAVRTALGARRARLFTQMITESCVLVLLSAAFGLAAARAAVTALVSQSPVALPSFIAQGLNARAILFAVAVSLVCGVIVGLAPAFQAQTVDIGGVLNETARGASGRRAQAVRSGLVVAEVSMAVVLLVGAGLMIRSVANLAAIDPGYDMRSLLTLRLSVPRADSTPPGTPAPPVIQSAALIERLRAIPGVTAVGLGSDLPLDGNASASFYAAEGMPAMDAQTIPRAYVHRVSTDFFSSLGVKTIAGRSFKQEELTPDAAVTVVSERLAKRFWPDADAIGKRIKFGPVTSDNPWLQIVGVVGDVKYRGLPDNPTADPDIYIPFTERNSQYGLAVRTSVPPESLAAPLRAAIRQAEPSIAVYSVATMESLVRDQTSQSRFTMWLLGLFAVVALSLAVIGLYGVMSYLVTQRTREIGVRMALGAGAKDIVRLVVLKGVRLVGLGIAVGIALAFAMQRLAAALFFGVSAMDVASALAVILLGVVAFLACYVPAARAARIDPLIALRYE